MILGFFATQHWTRGVTETFCLCPWSSDRPVSGSEVLSCDQMPPDVVDVQGARRGRCLGLTVAWSTGPVSPTCQASPSRWRAGGGVVWILFSLLAGTQVSVGGAGRAGGVSVRTAPVWCRCVLSCVSWIQPDPLVELYRRLQGTGPPREVTFSGGGLVSLPSHRSRSGCPIILLTCDRRRLNRNSGAKKKMVWSEKLHNNRGFSHNSRPSLSSETTPRDRISSEKFARTSTTPSSESSMASWCTNTE